MKRIVAAFTLLCVPALLTFSLHAVAKAKSLLKQRAGFQTHLVRKKKDKSAITPPPAALFSVVKYRSKAGKLSAYLSKPKQPGKKYPAIIWITGGFPAGGIGDSAWKPRSLLNDQSAKIYRQKGMIMMYPFLRGNSGSAGFQEGFFGEVDDIISAYKFLRKQKFVDSKRIYLGGHSTGGTLALLVAASTNKFRAVFAFGPVADPLGYGARHALHNPTNKKENYFRAPINFLGAIKTPTYIIEGAGGNISSLQELQKAGGSNRHLQFWTIQRGDHFNILAAVNYHIASRISAPGSAKPNQREAQQFYDRIMEQLRKAIQKQKQKR